MPKFVCIYRDELERQRKQPCKGRLVQFLVSIFSTAIALINENGLKILVITGTQESGKTSSMQAIAGLLTQNGASYKAILQPRILSNQNQTTGYRLLFLPSNKEFELASKNQNRPGYSFHKGAFKQARRFLRSAPHPDIFMIDEFGNLELAGRGHFPATFAQMHTSGGFWIISMRARYLESFQIKLRVKFQHIIALEGV